MAGLEQLEIHSRSYLVRWVNVPAQNTISWSFQPRKRTINFGVFKHPGEEHGKSFKITASTTHHEAPAAGDGADEATRPRQASLSEAGTAQDRLSVLGYKCVEWSGKCESDRVTMSSYDVPIGEGGSYALVFDNTYSKQFSKTVTFVLMTYPTDTPPTSQHRKHFAQAISSSGSIRKSPKIGPHIQDATDGASRDSDTSRIVLADPRPKSSYGTESVTSLGASFYTGVLSKKRRKRNQGYARRFFSLDFTSSTLSYYKNRNSSALRGAIPLSLAAVGANEKARQISVDSGTEIWLLRAHNKQDFDGWVDALERASQAKTPAFGTSSMSSSTVTLRSNPAEDREWSQVEALVGRVAGITDAVRRLAKDTDPKYTSPPSRVGSGAASPTESGSNDYFLGEPRQGKPSFWRRKSSSHQSPSGTALRKREPSAHRLAPPPADGGISVAKRSPVFADSADVGIHDNCMALLRDLENVVGDFSQLVEQSRARRIPVRPEPRSRTSLDSLASPQEFYDAEEMKEEGSPIYPIKRDLEADGESPEREITHDAASINSASTADTVSGDESSQPNKSYFPGKPKNLYPLPHDKVQRRTTIPAAKGAPPSLVGFLRKNVGKDLSTIAMPVTANEPLSLCQKAAENVEYAELLNKASALTQSDDDTATRRLLLVAAFAISGLSSGRSKERAVRKPFNPMLGETFELVREDIGMRFIAEKVSHRPVRIAYQAEGGDGRVPSWTHTQAPAPSQKFWGKSAELLTEGKARVRLHEQRECYSWASPNCFLRNIIAGEKYMEPVGTMTITEEVSGRRAVATFKAGGMFSGRSEDVSVEAFEGTRRLPLSLVGKWTAQLGLVDSRRGDTPEETIWKTGSLVDGAPARFGMTVFAAGLNEVTPLEKGALPPTDSRLRPDQQAYESGDIDAAEDLKVRLEEGQRRRRREMEGQGTAWEAKWFEKAGVTGEGEEVWRLREKDGYWDVREAVVGFKAGRWDGVRDVFET